MQQNNLLTNKYNITPIEYLFNNIECNDQPFYHSVSKYDYETDRWKTSSYTDGKSFHGCDSVVDNLWNSYQNSPLEVQHVVQIAANFLYHIQQHPTMNIRYKGITKNGQLVKGTADDNIASIIGYTEFNKLMYSTVVHELVHIAMAATFDSEHIISNPYNTKNNKETFQSAISSIIRLSKDSPCGNGADSVHELFDRVEKLYHSTQYDSEYIARYYQALAGDFCGADKFTQPSEPIHKWHKEILLPMVDNEDRYDTLEIQPGGELHEI